MGALNYYYHTNVCEHCQRSDRLHVGKSNPHRTFHFQGYRIKTGADQDIVSLADWTRLFKTTPGILVDELDRVIEDPLKFLAKLDRPTSEQQKYEDSPAWRGSATPQPDPATEWRDAEGFAFYDGYFS